MRYVTKSYHQQQHIHFNIKFYFNIYAQKGHFEGVSASLFKTSAFGILIEFCFSQKDVFCKAEKILRENSKLHNNTLTRLLSQYNQVKWISLPVNVVWSAEQNITYNISDFSTFTL